MNIPASLNSSDYYVLAQTRHGVYLLSRWFRDGEQGEDTMCYCEVDFEPFDQKPGEDTGVYVHRAWKNLKMRNRHLIKVNPHCV